MGRARGTAVLRQFQSPLERERVGRNPKTGAEATVTPRGVLTFKASSALLARINGETINDEERDRVDGRLFADRMATARTQLGDDLFRSVTLCGRLAVIH